MKTCLIIGAGIAGLLAARTLQAAGVQVTVLDKGRGVGGRMATRRIGGGLCDHGAQFFTARSERFGQLVADWQAAGLAVEWTRGFADPAGVWQNDSYPRYRGAQGMTTVPKFLAQGLDVRLNARAAAVQTDTAGWQVTLEDGARLTSDALILTPPVPQSLDLLKAGGVALSAADHDTLSSIVYHPCIAVMARLDRLSAIPEPGGVQLDAEPIRWIADNTRKGISPDVPTVTIHGAPGFSRDHWEADRQAAGQALLDAAAPWLGSAQVSEWQVHGWRYSQPIATYHAPCLRAEGLPPLIFAGDAFAGPRVEGAALSGLAAADGLLA
jgi:predicted NAD/FAD-dependent oxidoreductase